jgi:tetratricopeptide (TPR) repeat protein
MSGKKDSPLSGQGNLTIQEGIELALQHHTAGRLKEAEGIYQQVLQADSRQPVALHMLGLVAYQNKNYDLAFKLITNALAIKPNYAGALSNLGLVLHRLKKLDEAVASYRKAILITPNFAEAHFNLGLVLQELGDLEEAAISYKTAIDIRADYREAHNGLGLVAQALGNYREAITHHSKAIEIHADANGHNNIGVALRELGRTHEALTHFHKAIEINSNFHVPHNNLGLAFFVLGRPNEAITHYNKAIEIKPDYAEVHLNLGLALEDIGRGHEALTSFEQALVHDPELIVARQQLTLARSNLSQEIGENTDPRIRNVNRNHQSELKLNSELEIENYPAEATLQKVRTDRINSKWFNFFKDRSLTIESNPLINASDIIFTMGSCFAREIRFALGREGLRTGPDFQSVSVNKKRCRVSQLPEFPHLDYFNSFTIRQELERASGQWKQPLDDYWIVRRNLFGERECFQDPYKSVTFGNTPENLRDVVEHVNNVIDKGLRESSVFFFTFGMVEVFRKLDDGRIACQKPIFGGGGGEKETSMHLSNFAENLENLEAIRDIIKSVNPEANIIMTVSPVPLERTFSGRDIIVANSEGKSTLRAVLGEFTRIHDDVIYFPSFEIVNQIGPQAFTAHDFRHVKPSVIEFITQTFISAYVR